VVYSKGTTPEASIRNIEEVNLRLIQWLDKSHLSINPEKSEFMVFTQPANQKRNYKMKFGEAEIKQVSEHKFLGLTIDDKLSWKQHIDTTISKCSKALNILKATCHKWWGADPACARILYQALIRSRLEFGGFLVASAN
jgi:hypothetical protein